MAEKFLIEADLDIEEVDISRDILIADALSEEFDGHTFERTYPEEDFGYNSHVFTDLDDDAEYLVVTYSEAEKYAKEDLESLIDDIGPVEAFGVDTLERYIDDDYFDEMIAEDARYRADELDEDDLIDELERYDLIDENDKEEDDDIDDYRDDPDFDEEEHWHYPERLLKDKREELIDKYIENSPRGLDYILDYWGDASEFIQNNPDCVNTDSLIDDILEWDGFSNQLARYDGREHEITIETDAGNETLYVYRID